MLPVLMQLKTQMHRTLLPLERTKPSFLLSKIQTFAVFSRSLRAKALRQSGNTSLRRPASKNAIKGEFNSRIEEWERK